MIVVNLKQLSPQYDINGEGEKSRFELIEWDEYRACYCWFRCTLEVNDISLRENTYSVACYLINALLLVKINKNGLRAILHCFP